MKNIHLYIFSSQIDLNVRVDVYMSMSDCNIISGHVSLEIWENKGDIK